MYMGKRSAISGQLSAQFLGKLTADGGQLTASLKGGIDRDGEAGNDGHLTGDEGPR